MRREELARLIEEHLVELGDELSAGRETEVVSEERELGVEDTAPLARVDLEHSRLDLPRVADLPVDEGLVPLAVRSRPSQGFQALHDRLVDGPLDGADPGQLDAEILRAARPRRREGAFRLDGSERSDDPLDPCFFGLDDLLASTLLHGAFRRTPRGRLSRALLLVQVRSARRTRGACTRSILPPLSEAADEALRCARVFLFGVSQGGRRRPKRSADLPRW